LIWSA